MTKRPSLKSLDRRIAPAASLAPVATPAPVEKPEVAPPADGSAGTKKQPGREGKKVVTVYLSPSVWRDVKLLAAKTDTTIDALMRRGLDMVLAEHGVNRGAVEE